MRLIKLALSPAAPAKEVSEERFNDLLGVRYFPQLECADWTVEQWIRHRCTQAEKKGKIGKLAQWLGKLHAKAIDQGSVPDVTIRWIHEKIGYGLFADRAFAKWEFIGEYTGILRRRALFFPDINDYCFMYPREWISMRAYTIDSEKQGNYTRYINHSDTPNMESVSVYHGGMFHIIFRTIQEIPAGTELTYDYGDIYWRGRRKQNYESGL